MEKKIDERTFDFALQIVDLYKYLIGNKEYILSKQVLRAGTSIGANVQEAQATQSKADFLSKMAIASKEARETKYWLRLLTKSGYLLWILEKRWIACRNRCHNQHHNKNSQNIL